MKLIAFAKLLNKKIKSIENKSYNPFYSIDNDINPFKHQLQNTIIWVENDENIR